MTDFSQTQKDYMSQLFNKLATRFAEKTEEIKTEFKQRTNELALEIQKKSEHYEERIRKLEQENNTLQKTVIELQRKTRKNNIIIFGLQINSANNGTTLANAVIEELAKLLEINISISDISNIYKIGTEITEKSPIIVEFISYFKKLDVLKNTWKLKGKNITINEDQCKEDVNTRKNLQKHLREARSKGLQAYIRKSKIYIGEEPYTLAQLESKEIDTHTSTPIEERRLNSAPSTPNPQLRQNNLICEFGLEEVLQEDKKDTAPEQRKVSTSDKNAKRINTRSTSSTQITPKDNNKPARH